MSYSEISAVHYHWRRVSEPSYDGIPGTTIEMNISIDLIDGERLKLTDSFPDGLRDAIDDARAAWAAVERDSERDRAAVARGERTGPEWLHALRALGSGTAGAYRGIRVDVHQISRLLDDVRASPSGRVAAAVVLAASGDPTVASKLRIAAGATANPLLRAGLESVADAHGDAALAEALEAIDEADRELPPAGRYHHG
ncbi:hypothetical protein BE08_18465 [Sorangium cellulosum]|uniref:Uncharacterized protein n=1 Tax=Sorangium cellulosum TaxID=56 RepID=A0A150PRT4_SORCE|nr:hypothetical protein BE08_18465 [Sorangium cellulosum]